MAKYWHGAFWTQEFLISCSWNPWAVTQITNSEHKSYPNSSQKRILRPTGSSTWGKFWERSPCISLTFTLLVDDHLYKKSGWVQSLSSQQCLQDPVWECGPWEISVLMHFLTPASGAMRSCSPCGWSQCDMQGLPYYIWYFLCKNRGHKRTCTYLKQYFHSL